MSVQKRVSKWSHLDMFKLIYLGPPPPPHHVQTWSQCNWYRYCQAGGWPWTERPPCYKGFHTEIRPNIFFGFSRYPTWGGHKFSKSLSESDVIFTFSFVQCKRLRKNPTFMLMRWHHVSLFSNGYRFQYSF